MLVSALGNMVFLFLFYLFSHRHFQLKFQISILSCQCCYCQNIASVCLSGPFYRVCFLFFCPFRISHCPFLAQPPLPIPQLLSLIAPYVNLGLGILRLSGSSRYWGNTGVGQIFSESVGYLLVGQRLANLFWVSAAVHELPEHDQVQGTGQGRVTCRMTICWFGACKIKVLSIILTDTNWLGCGRNSRENNYYVIILSLLNTM